MNKEINIAQNIAALRKKHHITQEQLAAAVNVSSQAVSKWENSVCQPDTLTIPLIADFFNVSIDYLFYGYEDANDDIYEQITNRVASKPGGTEEPFEEAVKISSVAQHGILHGMERYFMHRRRGRCPCQITGDPLHLLNTHGLSICSPKGFSAVVTTGFINSVNGITMKRAKRIFEALANEDCLRVTTEIINFQGISLLELKEKTQFDEERLTNAIEKGKNAGFILKQKTTHPILGAEFLIQRHHYNCLCLILSTIKMIEISLQGATRLMYFPEHSMTFDSGETETSDTVEQQSDELQQSGE